MSPRRGAVLFGCTIGLAGLGLGTVFATSHASAAVGADGDSHSETATWRPHPRRGTSTRVAPPSPPLLPERRRRGSTPRAHTWNAETKVSVQGSVSWPDASFSVVRNGSSRVVTTNDLPVNHTTGVFPIAGTDPAHTYDANPNHIAADVITWSLPADPVAARHPSCTSLGIIGVLTDGVVLYNALDANGRDAPAHEVLDSCGGHPTRRRAITTMKSRPAY